MSRKTRSRRSQQYQRPRTPLTRKSPGVAHHIVVPLVHRRPVRPPLRPTRRLPRVAVKVRPITARSVSSVLSVFSPSQTILSGIQRSRKMAHPVTKCRSEFSKVLSWRSSRGAGERRRTAYELFNSRRKFMEKC